MIVSHASAVWIIARKELLEHIRSKRLIITGSLYVVLLIIGLIVLGNVKEFRTVAVGPNGDAAAVIWVLHSTFFGFTFLSLLGIILMADTICGEWKDRTLVLVLTKPIARSVLLSGKLLGGTMALFAIAFLGLLTGLIGGLALTGTPTAQGWANLFAGAGWTFLGLLPFLGLGTLMSCLFRSPTTSFILGTLLKFVAFPVISYVGLLIVAITGIRRASSTGELTTSSPLMHVFAVIDPDNILHTAGALWQAPNTLGVGIIDFLQAGMSLSSKAAWGAAAIAVHLTVSLTISYLIVTRRDYP